MLSFDEILDKAKENGNKCLYYVTLKNTEVTKSTLVALTNYGYYIYWLEPKDETEQVTVSLWANFDKKDQQIFDIWKLEKFND
jgi:hypothetical protein